MKISNKFSSLKKVSLPISISLIFLIGSVSMFSTSAKQSSCLDKCYENSDYKRFKTEVGNGSETAQYCMNAALYNCGMSACPEKKTEYKTLRDKELGQAKAKRRSCDIALTE